MTRPAANSGNPTGKHQARNSTELRVRRERALELRIQGWSYEKIVGEVKVAIKTVREDVEKMLKERDQVLVPQLRAMEEKRLDIALAAAMQVLEANPGTELALKASDRIVRAVTARARLLGLEAPVELNVRTYEKTQQDLELEELVREAEVKNEITRQQLMERATGDPAPTTG